MSAKPKRTSKGSSSPSKIAPSPKSGVMVTDQLTMGSPPVPDVCPKRAIVKTEKAKAAIEAAGNKRQVPVALADIAATVPLPEWQVISDGLRTPADLTESELPEVSDVIADVQHAIVAKLEGREDQRVKFETQLLEDVSESDVDNAGTADGSSDLEHEVDIAPGASLCILFSFLIIFS
ncbi:hypothetical protein L208DRAFT_1374297 [Tricholoma matsutake]|nr:hypothetical protein L208DRAFT_1374297 [Tricholoma matsutake 945]